MNIDRPIVLAAVFAVAFPPAFGQQATNSAPQGTQGTPLVLPGTAVNLNPLGSPGARLNGSNLSGLGTTPTPLAPLGSLSPGLNFGPSSLGRLSPPAGITGISGIGRLGPPGSEPNLNVIPNLAGPPTQSTAGSINPITNSTTSVSSGFTQGGPITTSTPPLVNPTNPTFFNQVNPTGSSTLRVPSNNYRP
jgi:hypothetical protein